MEDDVAYTLSSRAALSSPQFTGCRHAVGVLRNQTRDCRAEAEAGGGGGGGGGGVRAEGMGQETSDFRIQTADYWHLGWSTQVRMAWLKGALAHDQL